MADKTRIILKEIVKQIYAMRRSLQREKKVDTWWQKTLTLKQFVETEGLKQAYTASFYNLVKQKPRIRQDIVAKQKYITDSEFRRGKTVFELLTAQWNFVEQMLELIEGNIALIKGLQQAEHGNIKSQMVIHLQQIARFQELRKMLYGKEYKYLSRIFKTEKRINVAEIALNKKELQREKLEIMAFIRAVDLLKRLQIHLNYQFKYIDAIENYYISVEEHATKSEMREMVSEERELEEAEAGHKLKSMLPVVINITSLVKLFAHNSSEEMRHVHTLEALFKGQRSKNIKLISLTKKELSLEQLEKSYETALKHVIREIRHG
ncbi:hypothetical protein HYV81_00435 [Candidatus Woesearchaeota archaeon]|nr:hypothetical protein [Candidatus Woesearchaeota archaeon]